MDKLDIGGQALQDGIIMRSRSKVSIARRGRNGIKERVYFVSDTENRVNRIPFIRGLFLLKDFYKNIIGSLKEEKNNKGKILQKAALIFNVAAAVFLFLFFEILLPTIILSVIGWIIPWEIFLNIMEGILRYLLFILYLKLLQQIPEIEVLLRYHGAEHKTVHCYEKGEKLSVENVKKYPRSHPRCGTNYVNYTFLMVFVICVFFGWPKLLNRIMIRTLTLPFAFIIVYELFYYSDKKDLLFYRIANTVFSKIQFWSTTLEPNEDMIEVGIRAIRPIIGELRMTVKDVLDKFGQVDGYLILEDVLGKSRSDIKLKMPFELTKAEEEKISEIGNDYGMKPLQYILGHWNFYGREFLVRENVLIPRFDTEILLEAVLHQEYNYKKVLDIGAGSGIIAITLGLELPDSEVIGVDISEDAFQLAEENRVLLQADNVEFRKGDLFEPVQGERFDLICSNPPYINKEDMDKLDWKVKSEPVLALYGGEDGLDFYRKIIKQAPDYLVPGGTLAFEIGSDQGKSVELYLEDRGFHDIKLFQDLQGFDRVILAQYE